MRKRSFAFLAAILLVTSAACTLLLDRDDKQCSIDSDCARFGSGVVCRDSICAKSGDLVDAQSEGGNDAGKDAPFGQEGCFPGVPTTNEEFLNSCTLAECTPFDNCGKLGICDGGLLGTAVPEAGTGTPASDAGSPATETCENLAAAAGSKPVYVTGSSNFPPFLKAFAPVLFKNAPAYSVVWQTSSSCEGVDKAFNVDGAKRTMRERPGRISEFYDPQGVSVPCLIAAEVPVDVGESDIYGKTCATNLGYDPTDVNVGEYIGPTMAMVFIVPGTSTQNAISAEAAQGVFGRGAVPDPGKLPWTDPNQYFTRASSTATNQIISRGIFVTPTQWWGVDKRTASNMATQMKQVPTSLAEKTIGIISTDFADKERGNLKTLAFQARGQTCAFWPDSTPFSKDKRNVRDGHYPLWGPLHFFTRLSGAVPSEAAGAFVLRFSVPRLEEELVKGIIESANVPACAMKVARDQEMGPIKAFSSPYHCDCYFDSIAKGSVEPACTKCTSSNECPTSRPACNYGYCELK
jgi:hypothetical protein